MTRLLSLGALLELLMLGIALSSTAGGVARAPELTGGGPWFNTPGGRPLALATLRNQVVLVEFWTGGCINCLHTLPWVKQWYARYKDQGLLVIGVHSPEFSYEAAAAYVSQKIADLGLQYPVVMDNDFRIWRAYNNVYWPTLYLIDKTGRIRYKYIGEGGYESTETMIRRLLAEAPG